MNITTNNLADKIEKLECLEERLVRYEEDGLSAFIQEEGWSLLRELSVHLSEWETDFIIGCNQHFNRRRDLSSKQWVVLQRIVVGGLPTFILNLQKEGGEK